MRGPSRWTLATCAGALLSLLVVMLPAGAAPGDVTFATQLLTPGLDKARTVVAGDLDGDGDDDLVVSSHEPGGAFIWYRNDLDALGGAADGWTRLDIDPDRRTPDGISSGDIDGDGDIDLVVQSRAGVDLYRNGDSSGGGDGTDWRLEPVSGFGTIGGFLLADVDGDGDLDLAEVREDPDDHTAQQLVWYRNGDASGGGTGQSWTTSVVAARVNPPGPPFVIGHALLDSADMDGDGDFDLVVGWGEANTITWHRNGDGSGNGDGSAWAAVAVPSGRATIAVGDLDGDGDTDIVSATFADGVRWHRNGDDQGGGDGTTWTILPIASQTADGGLRVNDLDHDGNADVLVGDTSEVELFRNLSGDGGTWTPVQVTTANSSVSGMAAADFDGDLDIDLAVSSQSDDTVSWYRNGDDQGGGDASTWTGSDLTQAASFVRALDSGDLDGDGDLDLVAVYEGEDRVVWFSNGDATGAGDATGYRRARTVAATDEVPRGVAAADLDGDGDTDVVTVASTGNTLAWHRNGDDQGGGDASGWTSIDIDRRAPGTLWSPHEVHAVDVDLDGDQDLVVAALFGPSLQVYRNGDDQGGGDASTWAAIVVEPSVENVFAVPVDVDGDGDLDLAAALDNADRVVWYRNGDDQGGGDASTWTEVPVADLRSPSAITAADLDGDLDPDLAVTMDFDNTVVWLRNGDDQGAGDGSTWTSADVGTGLRLLDSLTAGDLDGDGDLDLIAAPGETGNDQELTFYRNGDAAGGGDASTWTPLPVGAAVNNLRAVLAADLDADGDLDLASAGSSRVFVHLADIEQAPPPQPPSPPTPPSPPPASEPPPPPSGSSSDPADEDPIQAAVDVSQERFASASVRSTRTAAHAVLARHDLFADALSGSVLTGEGPLLFTDGDSLDPRTAAELGRVVREGGTVYVLGGEAALSDAVFDAVEREGLRAVRLAGASRVQTALAIADEAVRLGGGQQVALARAEAAPGGDPTAAWVDAITAGAWAARTGHPVLLTPTGQLHPDVEAWLQADADIGRMALGGPDALSDGVIDAAVADRVAGETRFGTAAQVARALWPTTPAGYVLGNGVDPSAWPYLLLAAGLGADADQPVLLLTAQEIPADTLALICPADGAARRRVVGPSSLIGASLRDQVEGAC